MLWNRVGQLESGKNVMAKYGEIGDAKNTSRQARLTYEFIQPEEIASGEIQHSAIMQPFSMEECAWAEV